ncbi:Ctf8p [Lachancea thermotolerans CBS 6340]|uniref:KLTH0D17886p n=1 Tax=Lachancea thermotolerans (strain ATCC 56472 / CBS 6340 / NRRL Y-8284) TaxID=559295 RepID=C5DFT9_LACTC|nr:KLTH0D17886p [Lachancea thermotolerans CBS 6340]CAR23044.1 KLTH0D17886p [Lachancea thermotolerans CBS 6340]
MPAVEISVSKLGSLFQEEGKISVYTRLGNTLLEIQGELEHPLEVPQGNTNGKFTKYRGEDIVRFGLLSVDEDQKRATLFVGEKQRLLGTIVKLETPLGLLKFDHESVSVELQDIIRYKIIFKDRPLPVM